MTQPEIPRLSGKAWRLCSVDYITDLADFNGVRMSRLQWDVDDEPPESRWLTLQRNHRKNEFIRPLPL